MKKTIFAALLAIMLAATPALADSFGSYNAGGYKSFAGQETISGNEYAGTGGWANGRMENTNFAYGRISGQSGFASMDANLKSCTWTADYGQTSMSFAKGTVSADGQAGGMAFGISANKQVSTSSGWVSGAVGQNNYANETGYADGQYAHAENGSWAGFKNQAPTVSNKNYFLAGSATCVEGSATTEGFSKVTIDPSGSNRSASAYTTNYAKGNNGVGGEGFVEAASVKGGQYAFGNSYFNYNGSNNIGTGTAVVNTSITQSPNSFSSKSYGFSYTKAH